MLTAQTTMPSKNPYGCMHARHQHHAHSTKPYNHAHGTDSPNLSPPDEPEAIQPAAAAPATVPGP